MLLQWLYNNTALSLDSDPEERFATFKKFLPFSFAFTASKTMFALCSKVVHWTLCQLTYLIVYDVHILLTQL